MKNISTGAGLVVLGLGVALHPLVSGLVAQATAAPSSPSASAAAAVASAMEASPFIVVTDVPGIIGTVAGAKQVLKQVTPAQIAAMIENGEIYGGMIPKVQAALACLSGRVTEVVIASGEEPGVIGKILRGESVGTTIVARGK